MHAQKYAEPDGARGRPDRVKRRVGSARGTCASRRPAAAWSVVMSVAQPMGKGLLVNLVTRVQYLALHFMNEYRR